MQKMIRPPCFTSAVSEPTSSCFNPTPFLNPARASGLDRQASDGRIDYRVVIQHCRERGSIAPVHGLVDLLTEGGFGDGDGEQRACRPMRPDSGQTAPRPRQQGPGRQTIEAGSHVSPLNGRQFYPRITQIPNRFFSQHRMRDFLLFPAGPLHNALRNSPRKPLETQCQWHRISRESDCFTALENRTDVSEHDLRERCPARCSQRQDRRHHRLRLARPCPRPEPSRQRGEGRRRQPKKQPPTANSPPSTAFSFSPWKTPSKRVI